MGNEFNALHVVDLFTADFILGTYSGKNMARGVGPFVMFHWNNVPSRGKSFIKCHLNGMHLKLSFHFFT